MSGSYYGILLTVIISVAAASLPISYPKEACLVTMTRLNLIKGLGPVLQIAEGWTVEIDPEVHRLLDERTDRTWPTTWFVPRLCDKPAFKDVYSVMNNWGPIMVLSVMGISDRI